MAGVNALTGTLRHRLVLLRHAKSSWAQEGQPDAERPLTGRGRRDAGAAGRWLVEHDVVPDRVLCSSATRTRETWQRAVFAGGASLTQAAVDEVDAIYQAETDTLVRLVRDLPETTNTALLVGHAPGLPALTALLSPQRVDGPLDDFPTSTIVVFASATTWADTGPESVRLIAHAVPRG